MYAKKGATVSLESFNSLTGILSGPVDLDEFNFSSSLSTIVLPTGPPRRGAGGANCPGPRGAGGP
jgi:hypothetical protein